MDIDTTRDEYRLFNDKGKYTLVKLEYDVLGVIQSISGPVFLQAADPDGLRTQIAKIGAALESPILNLDGIKRAFIGTSVNLNKPVPSRSDKDIEGDGVYTGTSDVPYVRNSLEEELTTHAAQAAQHVAEANGVEPALAVSFVPKEANPDAIQESGQWVADQVEDNAKAEKKATAKAGK